MGALAKIHQQMKAIQSVNNMGTLTIDSLSRDDYMSDNPFTHNVENWPNIL